MPFSDYPTEQKQISWKPVAIIAVGVLIAVFLVIGAVRFISGRNETSLQTQELENQRAQIEQTCQSAVDKEKCAQQQTQKLASQTGNVLFCEGLTDKSYDACVWELGVDKKDTSICENIVNEEWKRLCSDSVNYALAVSAQNVKLCDKIQNENKRQGCHSGLEPVTAENCATLGKDPSECEFLIVVKEANQKQDSRVCEKLIDEDRIGLCKEEWILVDDPDFDDLDNTQEKLYGTDPYKADTDGDGYSDSQEIAAGYNPNGAGKLP
ncbi:hypothetical protein HY771_01745 [Candidatus Uhrbacteria bacterium]|nr:hypothetical protein [Candidatus Uhrbacteria bacterium]